MTGETFAASSKAFHFLNPPPSQSLAQLFWFHDAFLEIDSLK